MRSSRTCSWRQLREAMMWCGWRTVRLSVQPVDGVPVFHPDVRVWEVKIETASTSGCGTLDPYARAGKRSGAWMTAYRSQENIDRPITPIVSNNSNFMQRRRANLC